jgi:hypothetical protein
VVPVDDLLLKFQAVDIGKFQIQDKASGHVRLRKGNILGGRPKRERGKVQGHQKFAQRFAHAMVIIHNKDDMFFRGHWL